MCSLLLKHEIPFSPEQESLEPLSSCQLEQRKAGMWGGAGMGDQHQLVSLLRSGVLCGCPYVYSMS